MQRDAWELFTACEQAVRVLKLSHLAGDTFAIQEDGEVSLANRETLVLLLNQLSRRPT